MNQSMTLQEEFSTIYAEVMATNDLDLAFHQARKLCHMSLTLLKTPESYNQLANVAAKHPHTAGLIHERMSKLDALQPYIPSVVFKATAYIEEMKVAGPNNVPLTKAHLAGIASIASFNPKSALKALSGFKNLADGVEEKLVVDAMITIIAKNQEVRISGLGYMFTRGTPESLIAVAVTLSNQKEETATPLITKVFSALERFQATDAGEEKSICQLIENIGAAQGRSEDALTAMKNRKSDEGCATARAVHAEGVNTNAVKQIARLVNAVEPTQDFLEKDGGEAAITVWEIKVESGKYTSAVALKGLLTLRFNVAQSGEKNLDAFNRAVIGMADNVCHEMTSLIYGCAAEGNIDSCMKELVFGEGTHDDDRNWVDALKATFDRVAKEVGYQTPSAVLQKAVEVIAVQEQLSNVADDLNGLLRHLTRKYE